MQPTARKIPYLLNGAFHQLASLAWGDPGAPPVLCVHGLTRNAYDFEVLAAALAAEFHVISVDLPGRGASDWLPDAALYQPLSYVQALSHVLAAIGRPVAWVGTSLGGICGMLTAAAAGAPITRMVLNDVGSFIPKAALAAIRGYIADAPRFAGVDAAAAYLRERHAGFGALSDAAWHRMAETSTRALPDGGLALHFDPAIAVPMLAGEVADMDLSPYWQRVTCPTLVLRGAESGLLLPETLSQMSAKADTHVVPGAAHAPALQDTPTIAVIRQFLRA
jgi:pimeloyl-ACP methyl ester carboxylesterase